MNNLYRFPLLILLLMCSASCFSQRILVTGEFSGISFDQFVSRLESQYPVHFYYNPSWTDSLVVNINAQSKPVRDVISQALAGTELHFAMDGGNNIYITYQREIMTLLPPDFFSENKSVSNRETFDYSEYERKEKQKKLAEAKIYNIGNRSSDPTGNATIAGNIRNSKTSEPIIGAAVFVKNPTVGVSTDQFGYYSLTVPKGRHEIYVQSIGMKPTQRNVVLHSDGRLDIELDEDITPLKEVVVESDKDAMVRGLQMGTEKLDIKTMRQIPLALGETDIMKVVLTLPGVQSVGEGTVGLNVRGGATNQNLILFNDAVVYNPSHLFGFFSTFNPDVLQNVELYKSGINAEFGGRLSAVLDVHSREGNLKKISGSGGISPITGRFTLEGPLVREKTSFIIGFRSTYSNWLLRQLKDKDLKKSKASFYDITGSISHKINDNNNLYLSTYASNDAFKLKTDTTYNYSDRNGSLKWKHIFNNKLYGVVTGGYSHYRYTVESDANPINGFTMGFNIRQVNGKIDFNYFPSTKHNVNAGISTTRYSLAAGTFEPRGEESLVIPDILPKEQGLESAVYISDNIEINSNLSVYAGLRYSFYQYLGPRDTYTYQTGVSREPSNVTDTVHFNAGKPIATYHGAEPRISFRYALSTSAAIKLGYNRMRQYIQMLSNTTAIQPTDIWKLSDRYIRPQIGDQISLGYYQYLKGNSIETSVETYYKDIQHTIDYKGGANLLLNHHLETDILDATGKAYGVELMVKKTKGKINGWVSYTYSRTLLKTNAQYSSEIINKGKYYPANYDKPHALNFIGNYKFSRRFNTSVNFIYSTGRPITLPIVKYSVDGVSRIYYSDRNQYRIPDYIRTDISINIEGNHKIKKLAHSSWTLAVYNLLGRKNAYSVFFVSENGSIKGYKLSIFARPIPTLTYNFKF